MSKGFAKKVFNNTVFSLLDNLLLKIATTVVFIILARLLTEEDVAAVGIAMGYLIFIIYLDVAPIRILLRDYPKISADKSARDELLTSLFLFWGIQTAIMFLTFAGLKLFILDHLNIESLSFVFFAITIDFIALTFREWLKIIYYADFRQSIATRIAFFITIFRLLSYVYIVFVPSLDSYAWVLIVTAVISSVIWAVAFLRHFHYLPKITKNTKKLLLHSLHSYGLWDHFNRMMVDTLFIVDTVILSIWVQLEIVGQYTIALKFVSLMAIIPMQLSRTLQVALSNYEEEGKKHDAINTLIKVTGLVSIGQFLGLLVFGEVVIRFLFGDVDPSVYHFALILGFGVAVLGLTFPLISVVNCMLSLKEAFFVVFFPTFLAGIGIYIVGAKYYGAVGLAYCNIIAYSFVLLGLIVYVKKYYPFKLRIFTLTKGEKDLMLDIFRQKRK